MSKESLLCLFLLCSFGNILANNCEILRRCGQLMGKVPECKLRIQLDLVKCLAEYLKDCHKDAAAQRLLKITKQAKQIFCSHKDLAEDFKSNTKCWTELKPCLEKFGNVKSTNSEEMICKEAEEAKEYCLFSLEGSEKCKVMKEKFVRETYKNMDCEDTSTTIKPSELNIKCGVEMTPCVKKFEKIVPSDDKDEICLEAKEAKDFCLSSLSENEDCRMVQMDFASEAFKDLNCEEIPEISSTTTVKPHQNKNSAITFHYFSCLILLSFVGMLVG